MNKRGSALAPETLVVIVLAVFVLVLFLIYIIPAIRTGAGGPKTLVDEQVELIKSGKIGLLYSTLSESDKKELEEKSPETAARLKLDEAKKDFEEALKLKAFDRAKSAYQEYVSVCKDAKYVKYCSDVDKQYGDVMLSKLNSEEEKYKEIKNLQAQKQEEIMNKLTEDEKSKYDFYLARFKEISKIYDNTEIGSSFEEPRAKFIALEREIRFKNDPKLSNTGAFKNLLTKTFFGIIKTYTSENRCDDNAVKAYFDLIKSKYSENVGVQEGSKTTLQEAYESIMMCYYHSARLLHLNPKENYMKVLNLYSEYVLRYPFVVGADYPIYYKEAVFYLGRVDCSKLAKDKCHSQIKNIIVKIGEKEEIVPIKVTPADLAVPGNKKLGCWYDYSGYGACDPCTGINTCGNYWKTNGDWEITCKANPCSAIDGPCGVDNGDGWFNLEDCCPYGQESC